MQACAQCFKEKGPKDHASLVNSEDDLLRIHMALFLELRKISKNPCKGLLDAAIVKAYKIAPGLADAAGGSMKAAFKHLGKKGKNRGSGKRLPDHIRILLGTCGESPASARKVKTPSTARSSTCRLLTRTQSNESNCSICSDVSESRFLQGEVKRRRRLGALSAIGNLYSSCLDRLSTRVPDCVSISDAESAESVASTLFHPEAKIPEPAAPVLANACVTPSSAKIKGPKIKVLEHWDTAAQAMARTTASGTVHATMKCGPDGFQIAVWPDGSTTGCEIPNALPVVPKVVMKKPAACLKRPAASQKRPAAAEPAEEEGEEEEEIVEDAIAESEAPIHAIPSAPSQAHIPALVQQGRSYSTMFYKKTGALALRECFGNKRQLFQINSCSKDRQALEAILNRCIDRLKAGEHLDFVKAWARKQV